jgi:hypothetical protein
LELKTFFLFIFLISISFAFNLQNTINFESNIIAGESYNSQYKIDASGPFNISFDIQLSNMNQTEVWINSTEMNCYQNIGNWVCENYSKSNNGIYYVNITLNTNRYLAPENISIDINYSAIEDTPNQIPISSTPTYYSGGSSGGGNKYYYPQIKPSKIIIPSSIENLNYSKNLTLPIIFNNTKNKSIEAIKTENCSDSYCIINSSTIKSNTPEPIIPIENHDDIIIDNLSIKYMIGIIAMISIILCLSSYMIVNKFQTKKYIASMKREVDLNEHKKPDQI